MTVTFLVMTLTLEPLTRYCIVIFLSPCSIYVWNMKAVCQNILKLSCQNQSADKVEFVTLTFQEQNVKVSSSHHPTSMYEIWKLPKLLFRAKVLTKFSCDLWPFDPKCIGIFLSPSCIYVWNMKAVCWRQLKLSCQNQSVDQVHLWPWPLTPKCIGIFLSPSCIYVSSHHPTSMYEIWRMYVENYSSYRVRTKVLTKFHCDIDLWIPKCIGIFHSPSCIYVWNMKAVR